MSGSAGPVPHAEGIGTAPGAGAVPLPRPGPGWVPAAEQGPPAALGLAVPF